MDTNRFRKRTNYALPPKRPAPVLDELGELRQAPAASVQPAAQTVPASPKPATATLQPLGQRAEPPKPAALTPEPPRPVYQPAATKSDEGVIDLSEPTRA